MPIVAPNFNLLKFILHVLHFWINEDSYWFSFSTKEEFWILNILAASIPAFLAPAAPIAVVATGIPPGIWTIDNKESIPFKLFVSIGTPITGSVVNDATIPGKCAAPPAPAMIMSIPLFLASEANWTIIFGVRCADTTCFSYGISK